MIKPLIYTTVLSLMIGQAAFVSAQEVEQEKLSPPPGIEESNEPVSTPQTKENEPEPKARMVQFDVPPTVIEGEDRDNVISKIEDTLNRIRTMKATFIQRGPQGNVDEGVIYIERPGKIRFEYTDDTPILLVGNDDMLSFIDYEVNQISRWPIDKTPLSVLVDDNIDLQDKDIQIPEMIRFAGLIKASVIQPDQKDYGYITLIFEESTMELKSWEVVDVQGYTTRVALLNPEYNITVDQAHFTYDDPRPRRRGPRR
ncbi:LolA family protein [Pseudemcibacter aquimaris]|uniref:LolA family protein n=1 Tax=Pseudemcibacter aquimaris TaxID=2857064 RepID=UPI002011C1AB|nr:outer membrane lipoprotein carrier protein LolA [Pseudemcibacter aquimaris]MCC3861685.1 outer membrane lipoprotein carrier protein LolA [Pseudemcibacter aquimaris]WDU58456.1 outer membrane lipoprotein carrier protein LolA [Pseudemcibacter aquimaris]